MAIAIHELIHPPFERTVIKQMAHTLWQDSFFRKAKNLLPPSSGYRRPEDFLEENLVEGTHLYLSELMGVEKNPLSYLLQHDHGSHVVSVILYDSLKKGYRDKTKSMQETVELLIKDQILQPGLIEKNYYHICRQANLLDAVPENLRSTDTST